MNSYKALIIRVIDGDTFVARIDLGLDIHIMHHVRLFGLNAPEKNTEAGQQAKTWLTNRIEGRLVILSVDGEKLREKYGRLLAVATLDTVNINQELINKGYAVAYDGGKRSTGSTTHTTATLPLPTPEPG